MRLILPVLLLLIFSVLGCHDAAEIQTDTLPASDVQPGAALPATLEAPMLAELVARGELPVLEKRLPQNPKVIVPRDEPGVYGGEWRMVTVGAGNLGGIHGRVFYTSMIHWSQDWKSMEPGILRDWSVSADGRQFTFFMRRGLRFSNGALFTADDVAFVFKYVLGNKQLTPVFPGWLVQNGHRVKFNKIDKHTFRFTFPEPNGTILYYMAVESFILLQSRHYLKQFIPPFISEKSADAIADEAGFSRWSAYFEQVVRLPFQNPELPVLCPWVRKTPRGRAEMKWVFERNPYFYEVDNLGRQLPYLDRLVIANVSEREQVYLKTISGEVDCQARHIDGDRARLLLQNQEKGGYRVDFFPKKNAMSLYFNQTAEGDSVQMWLNRNQNFRLALSLAVNRDEIGRLLNWGQNLDVREWVVPPDKMEAPELLKWFEHDVDRANFLLDSLGLVRDRDGLRLRPDGKSLVLTVHTIEFLPIHYLELVQEYWQKIGVKLTIKKMSYRGWWDFVKASKFDIAAYSYFTPGDETLILYPYHVIPYYSGTYWGTKWGAWYETQGKAGEKPTPEVMVLFDLWERIKLEINHEKQLDLIQQLRYESLKMGHTLIIKNELPGIRVIKNNMHNMSHGTPVDDWPRRGPGPDFPETYFKR